MLGTHSTTQLRSQQKVTLLYLSLLVTLGIEPKALGIFGKLSTTELHPWLVSLIF